MTGSHRLTVRAGGARVAIAASGVAEIIRSPRITRMPNAPPALLGVTHLRGTVLPIVSLGRLLDGEAAAGSAERVVVLRQDPPLGLAVDQVESLQVMEGDAASQASGQLLLDEGGGAEWLDLPALLRERFAAFRLAAPRASERAGGTTAPAATVAELAFLAFSLAEQEYALPLETVAEVLALPPDIAALPQTEKVLVGVFSLRDALLPVISLRALLGLPDRPADSADRIVVARIGPRRLAFVVDRISAILRVAPDRVSPAPSLFNKAAGEARIDRVLRRADGRGIVAILSPERVLADDRVSRLLAAESLQKDEIMATPASAARRERFVVIRLGAETYGLPIGAVDEVVRLPENLTRLPKAPAYVRGVMNLRGRVIPVIDQRLRFAVDGENAEGGRIVVVTLGALQAGFAVDAVSEILELDAADLLPAPELSEGGGRLFDRAVPVERDGRVILLIDPAALLNLAEADLLRDLTANTSAP
ncbi:MAG: CheW protein [Rubritepida sp.]|nr:CheW protein [Rubritepida sp.]